MEADYDPLKDEARILKFWQDKKIYKFDSKKKRKIFSIDTPPPTISGKMHIGHAFQYSQMDFIARFQRMQGNSVFYPFGTDDNGLPTEKLVEKMKNVSSKKMERGKFIELCLKTLKEITPEFVQDWKSSGISCDYDLYYSTIDKNSQKLSQKSFIELFKKGEVYQKEFPALWCPECQTSIAQAELEDKELGSLFSTLKFSCEGKDLLIATTRPELLGACVAVFVNPEDPRAKKLVGKKARVPIFDFEVPIIADKSASLEKGTGLLMICSYGDKYDAESIARHKLTPRVILNKDGTLDIEGYRGMKVREARKKILEDLKNAGLITEQKQIIHNVNVHERCGTPIEILPTEQWFIRVLDKRNKLLAQGRKIKWMPEFMRKRYENWVQGLEWDWNISRDRHFGIPIPVWKCPECHELIAAEERELPVDPVKIKKRCTRCKIDALPESKVFDTWQTSSISPVLSSNIVSGKIKQPFSLRCNAHDIIRTWDFYTITKSFIHENTIPWENMMVSGFVTLQGEKMSKSKGNVISPQEVISKYGADSLRFWAGSARLGEDIDYQEKEVVAGKKFINKIWNASKFLFSNLEKVKEVKRLEEMDRLLLVALNKLIESNTASFENYEYAKVKQESVSFFWHTFCDNYLELVKNRVYQGSKEEKESAFFTLYTSLLAIVKMIAPITPFVTEEVYQKFFKKYEKDESVHISSWPEKIKVKEEKSDSETLELLMQVLSNIRMMKSKAQKSMKAEIILTLEREKQDKLKSVLDDLRSVVAAKEIKTGEFNVEFI